MVFPFRLIIIIDYQALTMNSNPPQYLFRIELNILAVAEDLAIKNDDHLVQLIQYHKFQKQSPYLLVTSEGEVQQSEIKLELDPSKKGCVICKLFGLFKNPMKGRGQQLTELQITAQDPWEFTIFSEDRNNGVQQSLCGDVNGKLAADFRKRQAEQMQDSNYEEEFPVQGVESSLQMHKHTSQAANVNIASDGSFFGQSCLQGSMPLTHHEEVMTVDSFRMGKMAGMDDECDFIIKHLFKIRLNQKLNKFISGQNGLLLYGPPGTGKSLLAGMIAENWKKSGMDVTPKFIKGPEILSKMVGETERAIRDIFKPASGIEDQENPEMINLVVVDEIDALFPVRTGGEQSALNNRIVSQFLSVMDGLVKTSTLYVIGTTNRKENIDPAVLRPGRLGLHLHVTYQNKKSQEQILRFKLEPLVSAGYLKEEVLNEVVQGFSETLVPFSGAEIGDITDSCVVNMVYDDANLISFKHFKDSLQRAVNKKDNKGAMISYLLRQSTEHLKEGNITCSQNDILWLRDNTQLKFSAAILCNKGDERSILAFLTKYYQNHFEHFIYQSAEQLLKIPDNKKIPSLVEQLSQRQLGQKSLVIVENVDKYLATYPQMVAQMVLVFQSLCSAQGQALLSNDGRQDNDQQACVFLTMSQKCFKNNFKQANLAIITKFLI